MRKTLNNFIVHWQSFWFRQAPPHAIAIMRIFFGIYLIAEALCYLPFVPELFSHEGLVFSFGTLHFPDYAWFFDPPAASTAWIIAAVYMVACIGFTLGCLMRTSIVTMIVLWAYYYQLSFFLYHSSYHRIYLLILILLLISGADRTFSVHMWRKKGSIFAWETASILAQRLIAVQLCVTYVGVGLQKTWLPEWQDGMALVASIVARWSTSWGRWVIAQNLPMWFYDLNVKVIEVVEVTMPFGFWLKNWRIPAMLAGIAFHVGIGALMSIWWFVGLIPLYVFFWAPEEVYAWCKRYSRGRIR